MAEKNTIARPYARAVFEMAQKADKLSEWSESLAGLAAIIATDELQQLLDHPRVTRDQLVALIREVAAELPEAVVRFAELLVESGRLACMPEILALYNDMRAQAEGSQDVVVVSAYALKEAQQKALTTALSKKLGRQVSLSCEVDKELVGGVIIRAGDLVIDGSVNGQLNALARRLMH